MTRALAFAKAYFRTLGLIGAGFLMGCAYIGFLFGIGHLST